MTAIAIAVAPFHDRVSHVTLGLLLVVPVVLAAVIGGRLAALGSASAAALALALFLPPVGAPWVHLREDLVALVVFIVVTASIGGIVAGAVQSERRRREAEAARRASLEAMDRQRALLLRSVSHDLRTPLATVRAVVGELRTDTVYSDDSRREMLALAEDEVERLDRIVANLLSLSRIEAGALRPDGKIVEIDEVVERSGRRLEHLTRGVRFEVKLGAPGAVVTVDVSQFDQVLSNLVENAVRHSPPGGLVLLTTGHRGVEVEVVVEDEGSGVPAADEERIFEPFAAGSPTSAGVGLAICRALVEAQNGTVAVDRAPIGGARFTVRLPSDG